MDESISYGFCHCGCGEQTNLVPWNITRTGQVKGEPYRYIRGHQTRLNRPEYTKKDCGYETPCWIWNLGLNHKGYGTIVVNGVKHTAHKVYYERKYGPIPDGLKAHHKCDMRACVNPDHVNPVTNAVNTQLGRRTKLTREDADEIRKLGNPVFRKRGLVRDLSIRFGVSYTVVERIIRGDTWKPEETR